MKRPTAKHGLDIDYLRRCKKSKPEQRLAWLAAAREFARMPKRKRAEPNER